MSTPTPRRVLATAGAAAAVTLLAAAPASAEPPLTMTERVEDASTAQVAADALDELEAAADHVVEETDYDLWTVYVDSFDGAQPVRWANDTAIDSNADGDVLLLAIAVEDGELGFSVDEGAALSNAAVTDIEAEIREAVDAQDWVGASLVAADAIIEASTGTPMPTTPPAEPTPESSGSVVPWVVGGGVVLAVVVGGVALSRRRRTDAGGPGRPTGPPPPSGPPTPEQQWAALPLPELGQRAGSALVELDNDVRSSANELAFAEAQFGLESTRAFKDALDVAQQQLGQAFAIQQQLGDHVPETEDQQRQGLVEILRLCTVAEATLDDQTKAMDELRSRQDRAPQLLDELDQRAGELAGRVPAARDALNQLGATYPATALATVARAPEQAEALLEAARQSITEGRSRVAADDRGNAVAFATTAENALQQVGTLLDMVSRAGQTLADAERSIDGAIASLTSDVSDAGRLAPGDASIAPVVARAQAALTAGTSAKSGGDPIAALAELAAAEQALDAALEPRRDQDEARTRAAGHLASQIAVAQNALQQTSAYIETNRGAVGAAARTRLATASEALARATSLQQSQPQEALPAAQAAVSGANEALRLAQSDVGRWRSGSPGGYGGYGGRSGGVDPGSLVLGGILGGMLDGGRWRDDWGGGYGGSSRGGGGWGGSSTRSSRTTSSSSSGGRSSAGRRTSSIGKSSGSRRSGGATRRSGGSSRRSGGGRRR